MVSVRVESVSAFDFHAGSQPTLRSPYVASPLCSRERRDCEGSRWDLLSLRCLAKLSPLRVAARDQLLSRNEETRDVCAGLSQSGFARSSDVLGMADLAGSSAESVAVDAVFPRRLVLHGDV